MKAFFLISFFSLAMVSCNKQRVYVCASNEYPWSTLKYSTHIFSDKELGKYIRENTIELDGTSQVRSIGERYVSCTLKD